MNEENVNLMVSYVTQNPQLDELVIGMKQKYIYFERVHMTSGTCHLSPGCTIRTLLKLTTSNL